ncbi:uncharacterized protein BDZ99DRAFT_399384 [Mytilinidion resinicola]|uniref:Uncharacterized protein n=1 Tax=Mytilinidion resinicola TaxID=574789 RepID=A0A6A6Y424_9PEZI|nr:uncharacterized protein BDZ99DRAFT_399384 [Mytilinidion resinicola]KAF2803532.1 hypothetical protein BDZ99DRAFT_399384 [Mytilinidion resinicola]
MSCFQLQNVLGKTPELRFWHSRGAITDRLTFDNDGGQLYSSGSSHWRLCDDGACDLKDKELNHKLIFGTRRATSFLLTDNSRFTDWPNNRDHTGCNYLAILAFAWAYILSAKWVEMQTPVNAKSGPRSQIQYQNWWEKEHNDNSPEEIAVDLGCLCDDAAQWWAAVIAQAWTATSVIHGGVYLSPWSVRISNNQRFKLQRTSSNLHPSSQLAPPSSDKALQFLQDLCVTYDIHDQGLAALAMALLFPTLGNKADTSLPRPRCSNISPPGSTTKPQGFVHQSILEEYDRLPYYMTLSCNPRGVLALLGGPFFDQTIECNVVSPWLEPIFSIINKCDHQKLVAIMAKRQPSLAPLWLGAAILGLEKRVLQMARSGTPPVDLHAGAWTATTHSFISLSPSQPIFRNEISRADECRMLFLTGSDHDKAPICPWQPFGNTRICDTDIEVQGHIHCGHRLEYVGWKWDLTGRKGVIDEGYNIQTTRRSDWAIPQPILLEIPSRITLKSDVASKVATRGIFSWLRADGWPASEVNIRTHEWFDLGESDEELDSGGASDVEQEGVCERIKEWQKGLAVYGYLL